VGDVIEKNTYSTMRKTASSVIDNSLPDATFPDALVSHLLKNQCRTLEITLSVPELHFKEQLAGNQAGII